MTVQRLSVYLLTALSCLGSMGCLDGDTIDLQGAGATFPAPIYKRWFSEYFKQHRNICVNYQAIGSGAGIRQFTADLVDFGASDAAMNDKEMAEALKQHPASEGVLLLPMTAGSVAICYNLPGGAHAFSLNMSREVYVDIFLGKINRWNDRELAKLNPGMTLPDEPITVVRRAEGSGTTYAFTNHLAEISKEWKSKIGAGKSVMWPVGIGGKGNAGVAALIEQTPGAIGYLEAGYAEVLHLPTAKLQNKAGNFVAPTLETGQAALKGVPLPKDMRPWIRDPAGDNAYPIVTYTWMLLYKNYPNKPAEAKALREVLRYCLTDGQKLSAELGYIPLPQEIATEVLKAVDQIKP